MNRKGILIGKVLTSFPLLIFVFAIMLIFVIVSGFISVDSRLSEDLMGDFINSYIIFKDEVVTVNEAIEMFCKDKSIEDALKISLREHFIEEYGEGNSFALVSVSENSIDESWTFLYSWYGALNERFDEKISLISSEFFEVFNFKSENYQKKSLCNGLILYVKSGGANE